MKTYIKQNWPAISYVFLALALAWGVVSIGSKPDTEQATVKRCMILSSDSTDEACADWLRDSIERGWRLGNIDTFIWAIQDLDSAREYEAELNQLYALRLRCATGDIEDCRAAYVGSKQND